MPEGDTIHKLAAYLRPRLQGRRLDAGQTRAAEGGDLAGRTVENVQARGKHLLVVFDDGRVLRTHLGMWGSWHHYRRGEVWKRPAREAAVVLNVADDVYVCFKPREVELLREQGVRARLLATHLGPDLIADCIDMDTVIARARECLDAQTPIIDVLLDQRPAAGIGNVYKSEILFLEHIHPLRCLEALQDSQLLRLYARARSLLRANLGGGPRVTRRSDDTAGRLWVYGRQDQPCLVCRTPVRYALLGAGQRATYWCPCCQAGESGTVRVNRAESGLHSP
jgi:endonuclease-8